MSLMEDYRRRQAWANLSNFGRGLLMASAQNMPVGQGLAYGLAQMEQPNMREEMALQEAERKQAQLQAYNNWMMGQQPAPQPTAERLEREGQSASLTGPMGGAQPSLMDRRFNRGTGQFAELTPQQMAAMGPEIGRQTWRMIQASQKPPQSRTVKRGDDFVTQYWTGNKWEDEETAPRYKPEAVDLAGTVDALTRAQTASQRGKAATDLKAARVSATQMVDMGSRLVSNLREYGDEAVSLTGATARGLNTVASQGRALAKQFGMRLDVGDWDWKELASESSELKSQILGLAVAITKADQGSRPSDFDVQTSINRIAGNAGSASRTADVVESLLAEKMRGFEIYYNDLAPSYDLERFSWEEQLKRHNIDMPGMADPLGIR